MGKREGAVVTPPLMVGPTARRLVTDDGAFRKVENFYPTEEGGLVSVRKPMPLIYDQASGGPPANGSPVSGPTTVYGTTYGIFHGRFKDAGATDVTLLHVDDQIWVFAGMFVRWFVVVSNTLGLVKTELEIPTASDFPTQFVRTPTGVVIVPQDSRALFYDGMLMLPLGYDEAPSAPIGKGPESTAHRWYPDNTVPLMGVNDTGYTMDALSDGAGRFHPPSAMHPIFRYCRLGTIETINNTYVATAGNRGDSAQSGGYLLPGRYRCRRQWIDAFGNLSPWSPPSNDVKFNRQPSMLPNIGGGSPYALSWAHADAVRKQVAWEGLEPGPNGTIGQNLARTKDLENSGDIKDYILTLDASPSSTQFASIPSNMCHTYTDNIPDSWLLTPPIEVDPIPMFRLADLWASRLWMANVPGDEGALYWSMVGRWGTIEKGSKMYPDPEASAITGLKRVSGGLLVFTENGCYLVQPNDSGEGFRSSTVSATIGCVAPSSIATMRNGVTVWLHRDGFYAYDGSAPVFLWEEHRDWGRRLSRARLHKAVAAFDHHSGEYRCWVTYDGSVENTHCFTYNGTDWHERTDSTASGVTVTDDHRKLMLICGKVDGLDGAWVVDHGGDYVSATIETGWLRASRSQVNASIRNVFILLRETAVLDRDGSYAGAPFNAADIKVTWRRNWRAEESGPYDLVPYKDEHPDFAFLPSSWDNSNWGDTDPQDSSIVKEKWRTRRPFWARAGVNIESAEVFQLKITSTSRFEILAIAYEEQPREDAGAQKAR